MNSLPFPVLRALRALAGPALILAAVLNTEAAPPAGYHLVWGDEFSGSSINSAKWSWGGLPWGGNYHNTSYGSYITAEDSYLSGSGSLILRCRNNGATINGSWVPWTEGFVHSNGKFRYTYGYAEVRARFPVMKGTWPAFWTLADGWPPEFDIAEYFGDDNRMHMGYAYGSCCPVNWDSANLYNESFDQWHTYALEWGNGWANWYRDGVVRKSINASYITSQSMYLILNSGMTWGANSSTANPNYTEFDYCRVYSPGPSSPPTITALGSRTTPTNTPTPPLPFTIDDAETPIAELTLTAFSGNTTLVPDASIVITGSGASRAVTVTPAPNQGGSVLITLQLFDGEFTATETFTLTVSGTNSSPSISTITDLAIPSTQPWGGRAFLLGDAETPAGLLTLSAASSNPDLVSPTNITFAGSGSNRFVSVLATPGTTASSNSAFVTVTVSDGGQSAHTLFRVTVADSPNLFPNPGFEDGLAGWGTVFGGTLSASTSPLHDGNAAGKLTGRADWYNGLSADLTGKLSSGTLYRGSAWVRIAGTTNDTASLTVRVLDGSGAHYYSLVSGRASSSAWTRLAGDFTPVFVGAVTNVVLYAEGPAANIDLYVDDLAVAPRDPSLLVPLGSSWRYRDTGAYPGDSWTSPAYNDSSWATGPAQLGYGDGDEATILRYGAFSTNKYVTTWFRQTLSVANPWAWKDLQLRLLRDDGAIVYLNGTEIYRGNLTNAGVTPATFALSAVAGADESRFYLQSVNPSLLRAGANTLAVELHQDSLGSSDISFDLELAGLPAREQTLVAPRTLWKYNEGATDLGTAWRAPGYDDSQWKSGFGQLGYGDGDEGTVIGYGPSSSIKYPTAYFRREFVLNTAAFSQYILRLQRDDGAVVYLNGVEVFRSNLPNGLISRGTLATNAEDDGNSWFAARIPATLFRPGTNLLAVEVHQTTLGSTDLSFDLELAGYPPAVLPALAASRAAQTTTLSWPAWASGYSVYRSTNLASPTAWRRLTNSPAAASGAWRLQLPAGAEPGFYRLGNP